MTSSLRIHAVNASTWACQPPATSGKSPGSRGYSGWPPALPCTTQRGSGRIRPRQLRTPDGTAIPVEGSYPHQGRSGGGPVCPTPAGRPGEGELFSHAGNGPQQVILLTPHWTPTKSLLQPFVQVVQLLLQPDDVRLYAGTHGANGGSPPVLLRHQHGHHLVPAGHQRVEHLGSASLRGRTEGRTASAKWARTAASKASVLASVPVALAKSRTWRGLTTTTGSAAAAKAATSGSSSPPEPPATPGRDPDPPSGRRVL